MILSTPANREVRNVDLGKAFQSLVDRTIRYREVKIIEVAPGLFEIYGKYYRDALLACRAVDDRYTLYYGSISVR